jgi:hypothetical protein
MNGYSYAGNNPSTSSDPTGLCRDDPGTPCGDGHMHDGNGLDGPPANNSAHHCGSPCGPAGPPSGERKTLPNGTILTTGLRNPLVNGVAVPHGAVRNLDQFARNFDKLVGGPKQATEMLDTDGAYYELTDITESLMLFACQGLCARWFVAYLKATCNCYHAGSQLVVPVVPSIRGRMRAAGLGDELGLPSEGKIRYVPPHGYNPANPLPRGVNGGYIDRFGNEWTPGPSRTPGEPFEWDVILSREGKAQLRWLSRDGQHVNVSLRGRVTHL